MNPGKLWQLKKKLRGIVNEPPSALLDEHGNLVTSSRALEELSLNMYKERLKSLQIIEELKVYKVQRDNLYKEKLMEAQYIKTLDWTKEDLEIVLKQLKANKLFKSTNAGSDLKKAILLLMNQIKSKQVFPEVLKYCNITSLYNSKGSRKEFCNYRGFFRVTVLRSILDTLIYNDEYPGIDKHLTDGNVGARKNRNIQENIFVINAVLNNASKRRSKNIDIGIYDAEKCFDKLWAQECFNDVIEHGFKNDKLTLLYAANVNAQVAVKTRTGITKRITMNEIIMQGTVWGSLFCTFCIDQLGKKAYAMPDNLYN